jgi:hypothetical protein
VRAVAHRQCVGNALTTQWQGNGNSRLPFASIYWFASV